MHISFAQADARIGDIDGNKAIILHSYNSACKSGADLCVLPELILSGYAIYSLASDFSFLNAIEAALFDIAEITKGKHCALLFGLPVLRNGKVYNAGVFIHDGKIVGEFYKHNLPNHGIFNELLYYSVGDISQCISYLGVKIGVLICEDMLHEDIGLHYKHCGTKLLIVLSASPFTRGNQIETRDAAKHLARVCDLPIVYTNRFGADDSIIFDGGSFALTKSGEYAVLPKYWNVAQQFVTYDHIAKDLKPNDLNLKVDFTQEDDWSKKHHVYQALMLGLRNFYTKNAFSGAILGLSGGIDSSFVAILAADALGAQTVNGIFMPSKFSSDESKKHYTDLIQIIGCKSFSTSISHIFDTFMHLFDTLLEQKTSTIEVAEENLQARIRAVILMYLSNKFNYLLLNTGNKSECATGYCTLYGDSCGGFAPIQDLYKTELYALASWRNSNLPEGSLFLKKDVIPKSIILREPTAELNDNQKDTDSLPPYDITDRCLHNIIEGVMHDEIDVKNASLITKLLYKSEFKRRQGPIGTRISSSALNLDKKFPITNFVHTQYTKNN